MLTTLAVVSVSTLIACALSAAIPNNVTGLLIEALLASSLLAARSLYDHVADVYRALNNEDLNSARDAVSKIVGRDTTQLEEHGIAGAALETLAENASDGFIAPVFWGLLLGLPGLAAYKAINTLDSMIGHKTERYRAFGEFAARLDDAANWIPARITALLFWCCALFGPALRSIAAQAKHHRSPNAGWPESAMAYALGVKLSGPRVYATGISNDPWLNESGRLPGSEDLKKGLGLYVYSVGLTIGLIVAFFVILCDVACWPN